MKDYTSTKTKIRGITGLGTGIAGLYSTICPNAVMQMVNEYISMPSGELYGMPYITAIGLTLGIVEIVGGTYLFFADEKSI